MGVLVQFSGAEVMPVSVVPCWGEQWCCWFNVATLSRLERDIFRPARPDVGVSAKKFALCRCFSVKARKSSPCALKLGRNWRFMARWASFFAEELLEGPCRASFFASIGPAPVLDAMRCTSGWWRWRFCTTRSLLAACRRRVGGSCSAIPPDWRRIQWKVDEGMMLM